MSFAEQLPVGAGLIYRHFGAAGRQAAAARLAECAWRRKLVFLISADPALAREAGAAGVHWPEGRLGEAVRWRARGGRGVFTMSAHGPAALWRAAAAGADAALLSQIFPSQSESPAHVLGPMRASAMARQARIPVYALGGVEPYQADRLECLGFSGWAAVSGALRTSQGRSAS